MRYSLFHTGGSVRKVYAVVACPYSAYVLPSTTTFIGSPLTNASIVFLTVSLVPTIVLSEYQAKCGVATNPGTSSAVSYTHLTLPTKRIV